jgi:transposase
MGMGRHGSAQPEMWVAASELPRSPGHSFYDQLNRLLDEAAFDRRCEELCAPYYAAGTGRPSIAPGVYFRMLFVGYFEGLSAQRAIAWKCADSLSVRTFLGLAPTMAAPDHSSLTRIRQRLPMEVHAQAFQWVLEIAAAKGVLHGKVLAIDATTLEANAAMKSMVRRVSGEKWMKYLRRLAAAEGLENPTDEDLRRFDRKRKGKKVSNAEWASPIDPDSRIMKMKDGTTHFSYKAEHAVDLASDLAVVAAIYPSDTADGDSLLMTVQTAQETLTAIDGAESVADIVGDKGYHRIESLAVLREVHGVRTYIPERQDHIRHNWRERPAGDQVAFYANRRRMQGARGGRLSRRRSEYAERSFAHTCETGGGRRVWVRGIENVAKRYLVHVAARNLGVLMRILFGVGTPRSLQGRRAAACFALMQVLLGHIRHWLTVDAYSRRVAALRSRLRTVAGRVTFMAPTATSSTGC